MSDGKGKIFVTGTDTGVGKTVFTLALCLFLKSRGKKCRVIKPVETGCDPVCEDETLYRKFLGDDAVEVFYRLKYPAAPLTAGEREGIEIPIEDLKEKLKGYDEGVTLVEGAGGLLVPVNYETTYLDLILALDTPVMVVAGNKLGVINHTLLTVDVLDRRGIKGIIILNDLSEGDPFLLEDNLKKIKHFSKMPVAGRFPYIEKFTEDQLIRGIQPLYTSLEEFAGEILR